MGRGLRAETSDPKEVGIVHCVQRCVRKAYLAGVDPVSGQSFEFRREWIRRRLELLSAVFGIDVLTYAVMSNHLHVILRNRPDVVEEWSDEQAATRWLKLFPGKRLEEHLGDPTRQQVEGLVADKKKMVEIRTRLSDISWFMRALAEPIARLANRQDQCTGRFWEGRFKAMKITDEASLLACSIYVDLNPIRAAMTETPEQSKYTSAYDRIAGVKGKKQSAAAFQVPPKPLYKDALTAQLKTAEKLGNAKAIAQAKAALQKLQVDLQRKRKGADRPIASDAWLAPLTLDERRVAPPNRDGLRASNKGFLSMQLQDYLKLLDWTGRQQRSDKRGKIPGVLAGILSRIGIESSMWRDLVWNFKRYFGRSKASGSPDHLREVAKQQGKSWLAGTGKASACFA